MPHIPGNVVRVNRVTQQVEVAPVGLGGSTLEAVYPNRKRPPAPLSLVFLEQQPGGQWIVQEAPSLRHELVDDDFMKTTPGASAGEAQLLSETNWTIEGSDLATLDNVYAGTGFTGGIYGVVVMYTEAVGGFNIVLRKDDLSITLTAEQAIWFSANVAPDSLSNVETGCGLANLAFTDYAYADWQNGGALQLFTSGGNLAVPYTPATDTFFTIDIVCIPSVSASIWVNGDGPYTVLSTACPRAGQGIEPYFFVTTSDANTKQTFIDWCHVEAFTPVIHPDRLYDIGLSGTSAVGHSYLGNRI